MHIRKSFAALCASLLTVTILGFGFSWSAWQVLAKPSYIKNTLRDSGIYDAIAQDIVTKNSSSLLQDANLPTDQPAVQHIISSAITPSLVQQQTEKVIDNSFSQLRGDAGTLKTDVDLSAAQQHIADSIAAYTKQHLSSLPTCTSATAVTPANALDATCLPPHFDINAAAAQAKSNVLSSNAFASTNYDTDQIKAGDGKTLAQQLQSGQHIYQRIEIGLYAQAVLIGLLAIGLLLLSTDWRIGMRRVGVIALWTGAVSALMAWLSSIGMHFLAKKITQTAFGTQLIQQKLVGIASTVVDDIEAWWLCYGAVLAIAGLILLLVYRVVKPAPAKVAAALAEEEGIDISAAKLALAAKREAEAPVTAPPATSALRNGPPASPQPPKRPRRIQ